MSLAYFLDPSKAVADIVERWQPIGCSTEREYEESLYDFLHSELPTKQITRQYPRGRNRVDLRVGEEVVLELKANLSSKNEFHRLVGQLTEIRFWDERIVVVFAGKTDPHFPKQLLATVKDWDDYLFDPKVRVVIKA